MPLIRLHKCKQTKWLPLLQVLHQNLVKNTLTDQDMEGILKKRNAANTDKVTGNSVNIIRKYLNEKNLPVDYESLDDKALDELLSKLYCVVRTSDGELN